MKLKTTERGFTLIELVVGLSIAAFVVGAASMTTITMMRLTPQNNDWAVALRQVQNAGYWISRDIQMSQGDIVVGTGNPTLLTITQPVTPDITRTIVYQFEDMSGGLKRLMRNEQGQAGLIAEYIYFDLDDPDSEIAMLIKEKRGFQLHPEYGTDPSVYYIT